AVEGRVVAEPVAGRRPSVGAVARVGSDLATGVAVVLAAISFPFLLPLSLPMLVSGFMATAGFCAGLTSMGPCFAGRWREGRAVPACPWATVKGFSAWAPLAPFAISSPAASVATVPLRLAP